MKQSILILFAAGLLLWGCNPSGLSVEVRTDKKVSPVFIRQEENSVLHICMNNKTGGEVTLKKLRLSAQGTSRIEAIDRVRVYFTGLRERFSPEVMFGRTHGNSEKLTFEGRQTLMPGKNHFWVSVHASDKALLTDSIGYQYVSATVSGADVVMRDSLAPVPSAVGYAVRLCEDDGVKSYRIPGMVRTPKGTLIAVYDIRRNSSVDLQEDIDIGVSRSLDDGQTWLPMQVAVDMGEWGGRPQDENGIGDPCILVDPSNGRVWVAGLWLHGHPGERAWTASRPGMTPRETGQFILAYSDDEGATWSEPINITSQVKDKAWNLCFQGPGMGIAMKDGTLVFPAQFKDQDAFPFSTIVFSRDGGKTWRIGTGAQINTTESQVVELMDGSLMLNMRDNRGGSRSVMVTKDMGATWTDHVSNRSALIEPVCQASIIRIRLKDGRPALAFFNPADTRLRVNSTLKISLDDGETWPEELQQLVYEPASFGYSCLAQIDDETIGVLYEGAGELYFQRLRIPQ